MSWLRSLPVYLAACTLLTLSVNASDSSWRAVWIAAFVLTVPYLRRLP